jgi:integrase
VNRGGRSCVAPCSVAAPLALPCPSWEGPRSIPNRSGTDARRRKDGRYETRATLDTSTGRKRVSFYGKIRRRDFVMRSLRRFLEKADLPPEVRFHDLRHTADTLAWRQEVPLHTVSRTLGHSDPAMTLRRYAHVLDDMRDDAARAMDELF